MSASNSITSPRRARPWHRKLLNALTSERRPVESCKPNSPNSKRLRRSRAVWWSFTARFASTFSVPRHGGMPGRTAIWIFSWWLRTMPRRTNCILARGEGRFGEPDSPRTSCRGARPISRIGRLGSGHRCRLPSCAKEGCFMKPSEARARETREWLGKAAEDLASAHVLIGSSHFSGALFFCQQAAEKSLKAFLTWHERTFRRTHDLEEQIGRAH